MTPEEKMELENFIDQWSDNVEFVKNEMDNYADCYLDNSDNEELEYINKIHDITERLHKAIWDIREIVR